MKYNLTNVIGKTEEGVMFGTCDLCQHLGTHFYDVLEFEDEQGNRYEIENGGWCYGSYFVAWYIDNYIHFAHFITGRDYPTPDSDDDIHSVVQAMYNDYVEHLDEQEETE